MRDLSIVFSALADPTRLEMLALLLRNQELCVCDFVGALGVSQSKASRHLRYLWNARLLDDRQCGVWVYYRIARKLDPERQALLKALAKVFAGRDLTGLDGKLAKWLERKNRTQSCAVPAPKPAAKARTGRSRSAAEAR